MKPQDEQIQSWAVAVSVIDQECSRSGCSPAARLKYPGGMDAKRGLGPGEEPQSGGIAEARPSASIIVLRDSDEGPEVLLVERNHEQRFMGGAWVFPGGATHDEDDGELATAVRELEEEAGISLSADAEPVRFSRWITPAQVKMRFDTHFFVVRAPDDAEPEADGTECLDVCWIRPREALDAGERGELKLVFPTIKHLEELATYGTVEEALAAARERRVMPVQPRVLMQGGVAQVLMPGEPGYDD
jgi:8-oxo-dGTP pyrophosphatase MutT (NUDIX family)